MSDPLDELESALSARDLGRIDGIFGQVAARGQAEALETCLDRLVASLSVECFERIHRVCLAFEHTWKCGLTPAIETFLPAADGIAGVYLLMHLLQLDIECRRKRGVAACPEAYHQQFPEWTGLVRAAFLSSDSERAADPQYVPVTTLPPTISPQGPARQNPDDLQQLACPNCGEMLQRDDETQGETKCAACGSTFRIDPKASTRYPLLPRSIGRFEIIERLGKGAYGVVYKAWDPKLQKTVALKLARPEAADLPEDRERFQIEARSAARLRHPHIAQVHDIDEEYGVPYIVSEFIQGIPLDERLTGDPLTPQQTTRLIRTAADGLAYAHEHGVFHRDIKPSNLVIDHNDQPCLIDFGLAHWIEDQGDDPLRGRKYGTPPYMSPEQVRMDPVLAASDIWSLGVVLYQLLTGEYPFRGRRRMLEQQIQHEEPRRPRELNDHVPRDLETICLKCLEKDPRNRYASAAALRDDLDRYLRDEPILARPIGPPTRVWRWCLRNRALASLIVTVISLVVLLSIFAVLLANSLQKERKLRDEIKWKHKHSIEFCITKVSRYVNDIDTFARSADTTAEADSIISLDDLAAGGPLEVSPVFTTEIPRIEALSEILLPMITGLLEDSLDPHVLATDSAADAVDALGDLGTSTAEAIRRLKFLEDRKSVAPADINEARMAYQSLLADVMDGLNQEASRSDSPVAQKAENELQAIRDTLNVKSDDLRVED